MSKQLYVASSVRIITIGQESILHNLQNGRWIKLCRAVVSLVKQPGYKKKITDVLKEEKILAKDFSELLKLLVSFGFLTENQNEIFVPSHDPVAAYLNVTNTCNLECKTCYFGAKKKITTYEMSTVEVMRAMDKIHETGINYLIVAGGEPLMRQDIQVLLEYAHRLFQEVTLLTNGILVDKEIAKKIALNTDLVQVSLDGPDEQTNRQIRGTGSFAGAVKGIRLLKSAGVNVLIVCTVTRINIPKLPKMALLAQTLGVELGSSIFLATGYGACNERCLSPAWQDLMQDFREEIFQLNKDDKIDGSQYTATSNLRIGLSCGSGVQMISVAPDGTIYPCHVLHKPEFAIGNILSCGRLIDTLNTSSVTKKFRRLDVDHKIGCKKCDVRYFCRGGCIAQGFASNGKLDGKDKFCPLFKRVFRTQVWTINDHMTDKEKANILIGALK